MRVPQVSERGMALLCVVRGGAHGDGGAAIDRRGLGRLCRSCRSAARQGTRVPSPEPLAGSGRPVSRPVTSWEGPGARACKPSLRTSPRATAAPQAPQHPHASPPDPSSLPAHAARAGLVLARQAHRDAMVATRHRGGSPGADEGSDHELQVRLDPPAAAPPPLAPPPPPSPRLARRPLRPLAAPHRCALLHLHPCAAEEPQRRAAARRPGREGGVHARSKPAPAWRCLSARRSKATPAAAAPSTTPPPLTLPPGEQTRARCLQAPWQRHARVAQPAGARRQRPQAVVL